MFSAGRKAGEARTSVQGRQDVAASAVERLPLGPTLGREIDIEGGRLMATAENTDTKKKKKKRGCFWRIVFWLALVVFIGSV